MKSQKHLFLFFLIIFSCGGNEDGETTPETDNLNVYEFFLSGKKYEVVKENKSWEQASQIAVERGGYLAEIDGASENAVIFSAIINNASVILSQTSSFDGGGASYVWIGGNDKLTEGRWIWNGNNDNTSTHFWQGSSNGSSINSLYENWGVGEPDNFQNSQNGLALALTQWPLDTGNLGSASQWNDISQGNALYFIIEYD